MGELTVVRGSITQRARKRYRLSVVKKKVLSIEGAKSTETLHKLQYVGSIIRKELKLREIASG